MASPILTIIEQAPQMDAHTAWKQISLQTKMACGARGVVGGPKSLQFAVGKRGLRIIVTLTHSDTYNVYLISTLSRKGDILTIKKSVEDVYCDSLSQVVYDLVNVA